MAMWWAESSTEAEEQKAYKDHADLLVTFIVESHNMVIERLNGTRGGLLFL